MDEYMHAFHRSFKECRAQGMTVIMTDMWLKKEKKCLHRKTLNTGKQNDNKSRQNQQKGKNKIKQTFHSFQAACDFIAIDKENRDVKQYPGIRMPLDLGQRDIFIDPDRVGACNDCQ